MWILLLSSSLPEVNPIFQVQSQKNHRQVQLFPFSVMQWFSIDGIKIHLFLVNGELEFYLITLLLFATLPLATALVLVLFLFPDFVWFLLSIFNSFLSRWFSVYFLHLSQINLCLFLLLSRQFSTLLSFVNIIRLHTWR